LPTGQKKTVLDSTFSTKIDHFLPRQARNKHRGSKRTVFPQLHQAGERFCGGEALQFRARHALYPGFDMSTRHGYAIHKPAEAARAAEDAKKPGAVAHADSAKAKAGATSGQSDESFDSRLAKRRPRPASHRVEEKVAQFREHPMMMEHLEKNVLKYREEERAKLAQKKEEEAQRNARKRPQGPVANEIHMAVQQAKAEMVRERRERAAAQKDDRALSLRDRRKRKKAEEEAARRRAFHAERLRGLMLATVLASRVKLWAVLVEERREQVANDTQREQREAVCTIESYYLAFRFKRMMKNEREKLAAAARVLQRNYRIHYGQIRLLKRKVAAGRVAEFMRAARRTGMIKVALKKFRMACVLIQRCGCACTHNNRSPQPNPLCF
jgi:hypothetical protein